MSQSKNPNLQEENDFKKIFDLVIRNYKLFIISIVVAFGLAIFKNRTSIPIYEISSSILIKEDAKQSSGGKGMNDFLNSSLFGVNQNFQNELWVLKSSPVVEQTIRNLDLSVSYQRKQGFLHLDAYKQVPFQILPMQNHDQPLYIQFTIEFQSENKFLITAEAENVWFYNAVANKFFNKKGNWTFRQYGTIGKLINTKDLAIVVQRDSTVGSVVKNSSYGFRFSDIASLVDVYKDAFAFNIVDKKATVIEINLQTESVLKGIDLVNELMNVYSTQNLDRKNHIAFKTIDYIEKQLNDISDSLSQTEDNLQSFRSSNQLLNVTEQATGISAQYMNLQNQRAELMTHKRYYEYVADYLEKNDDFSNMIAPVSMGVPDQMLNNLTTELISSQAQRANLIVNKQGRNPLVKKLDIKIDNLKKTISENIAAVRQTTEITIDEMNKRIGRIESQISRMPKTQRQLGGIERKYRLNDAIYNYLLEKRAEAKITQASNLPDDVIIEPASQVGSSPISPNTKRNYMVALLMGLALPFGFLMLRSALNTKIETQDTIERLTEIPVLGKILHNSKKTDNVVFEYPTSTIAESYRALRTNLDFYLIKGGHKKIILVTSCVEGEGKSFNAMNIAMCYAQLGRKTILLDFDLRKPTPYFNKKEESSVGLSSYLIDQASLEDIIIQSPHEKMDYICSGPIPPNPAELLALEKAENLIDSLKEKYDYIIIDTPPLAQVTDGFLLMEKADIKIIITRYNYSKKSIFSIIMKDLRQKNIKNVCIVLNDNKIESDQYGYGYGYSKKK
ncbi:MAG: GumC family protein [Bacteroidales bacterium]